MPSKPPNPHPAGMGADPTDAFEVWLRRGLHHLYAGVVAEPIPPELLRLVDGLGGDPGAASRPLPLPDGRAGPGGLPRGFEQRVRERAYFLWLEEGSPDGKAAQHWRLAMILQAAQEANQASATQDGLTGTGAVGGATEAGDTGPHQF